MTQHENGGRQHTKRLKLLPGVARAFESYDRKGYNIILTSGRRESSRAKTEKQLTKLGLFWDQLVLGVKGWPRVLINNMSEHNDKPRAIAYNVRKNEGFSRMLQEL